MGRIRTIKPEIHSVQAIASLPDDAWRTLVGLLSLVDDEGRSPADPTYIGTLFWAAPRSSDRVKAAIETLAARGLIQRYSVQGVAYLLINGWREGRGPLGQRINRPQPARYPAPTDDVTTAEIAQPAPAPTSEPTLVDEPTEPSKLDRDAQEIADAAVRAINRISGKAYDSDSIETLKACRKLAKAGVAPDRVVAAIDHVARPWVEHPSLSNAIRPSTLLQLKRVRDALDDIQAGNGARTTMRIVDTGPRQLLIDGEIVDIPEGVS